MPIHHFQKIRKTAVTETTDDLLLMRSPFTGQIKALNIWLGATVAENSAIINLSINGSLQWSGSDRIILGAGAESGEKTALSLAVAKGDIIAVHVVQINASGLEPSIEIDLSVDDLIVYSQLTTETLQDAVAAMMTGGTNSSWIYDDLLGTLRVDAPQLSDEQVQDKVAAMLSSGGAATVTYDDGTGIVTISSTDANRTNEEIQDVVAGLLTAGSNVSLTYNDAGNTLTINSTGGGGGSAALDDLTDVAITDPAAGDVIAFDGSGWLNQQPSGGSGGGSVIANTSPGTIAAFTALNDGDALAIQQGSEILFETGGGASDVTARLKGLLKNLPAAPYRVSLGFKGVMVPHSGGAFYNGFGLILHDSVSGKCQTFMNLWLYQTTLFITNYTDANTYLGDQASGLAAKFFAQSQPFYFLQVEDDGTAVHFRESKDGHLWLTLHAMPSGTFLTPDSAGFYLDERYMMAAVSMRIFHFEIEDLS